MAFHEALSSAKNKEISSPKPLEAEIHSPDKAKSVDYHALKEEFLKEFKMPTFRTPHEDNPDVKPGDPPGNSFTEVRPESPKGQAAIARFNELGVEPKLEYKDNKLDMGPVAIETVAIEHMTSDRDENFKQAEQQLADRYNAEKKDGRTDWEAQDIRKFRRDNHLTWHENEDMKTCQLVPTEIHDIFPHTGGVSLCGAIEEALGGLQ